MGDSPNKERAHPVLVAIAFSGRDQNLDNMMLNIATSVRFQYSCYPILLRRYCDLWRRGESNRRPEEGGEIEERHSEEREIVMGNFGIFFC